MSKDNKTYVARASLGGKNNGQIATGSGPVTVGNKTLTSIDSPKQGSKEGILKKK